MELELVFLSVDSFDVVWLAMAGALAASAPVALRSTISEGCNNKVRQCSPLGG